MAKSSPKSKKHKYRKIVLAITAVIVLLLSSSVAAIAYKNMRNASDENLSAAESTAESTAQPTAAQTPSPTPRAAFIPDPDELLPLPDFKEIQILEEAIEGESTEGGMNVSWELIEDAAYYVLCAVNEEDNVYHKEILWPDISSWIIPETVDGYIYLLSYQDMGEDSAEDDELITVLSKKVEAEEEPVEQAKPTAEKTQEEDVKNKYYIIVDKEDFTFGVFTYDESGEYTVPVKAFPTAIGRSDHMTPEGVFEISSKGAWKDWHTGSFSPFYTRFTSGLYFHGAIYDLKKNNTMFKSSYRDIGTASTSGCLRTTIEAAKWIYYNCPAGTEVEIATSSDMVDKVERTPLDPYYPKWDPTDPDKPKLSPPAVVTNTLLKLDKGEAVSLEGSLMSFDGKAPPEELIYEVLTPPVNGTLTKEEFTQSEIDNGDIIYTHDGSETTSDSFRFTVTNLSSQTGVITFSMSVNLVDSHAPVVDVNEGMIIDIGESASLETLLSSSDNMADASQVVYTVTVSPVHGSVPLSFTQEEISSGEVVYAHDGSQSETDSFTFSVTDGTNTLSGQIFLVTVNVPD